MRWRRSWPSSPASSATGLQGDSARHAGIHDPVTSSLKKNRHPRCIRTRPAAVPGQWLLCLVQFVDVLGVTEMITAMPRILGALARRPRRRRLLLTAYAMCFGGLLMLGARLGDRFGHRRMLLARDRRLRRRLAGCAAPPPARRCAGRRPLPAGASAAAISVPSALRLLSAGAPDPARRGGAMAAWSAAGAAAGAAGYLVGGGVTELAGWRAMFWLNLPLAALMAAGVLARVERDRAGAAGRLDLPGAALFTAAVMGVVLAGIAAAAPRRARHPALAGARGRRGCWWRRSAWTERRSREPLFVTRAAAPRAGCEPEPRRRSRTPRRRARRSRSRRSSFSATRASARPPRGCGCCRSACA